MAIEDSSLYELLDHDYGTKLALRHRTVVQHLCRAKENRATGHKTRTIVATIVRKEACRLWGTPVIGAWFFYMPSYMSSYMSSCL